MAEDRADMHELPTPRSTLQAHYVAALVSCRSCFRSQHADLEALVAGGRGDVPLIHLRFRCSNCGGRLTDFVCTSKDAGQVQPRRAGAPDQPTAST
jgi:hypothetical protein